MKVQVSQPETALVLRATVTIYIRNISGIIIITREGCWALHVLHNLQRRLATIFESSHRVENSPRFIRGFVCIEKGMETMTSVCRRVEFPRKLISSVFAEMIEVTYTDSTRCRFAFEVKLNLDVKTI